MTDYQHSPVREIPIGTRSITGTMPGGTRFESTLERDLMYILRFDINVDKYIAQPVKIGYQDKDGQQRSYTPDILIFHRKDILPAKNMPPIRVLNDPDKPLVVICSQLANSSGTSVTNAAEILAQSIKDYLTQDNLPLAAAIQRYIKTSRLTKILGDLVERLKESKNLTVFPEEQGAC